MISNGELWHYPAVKKLSALLRGITSINNFDFHCQNCLHSFRIKSKLKPHEKVFEIKDFCNVVIPSEQMKILAFNQNQKSNKAPFMAYPDRECLIEKIDEYKDNLENSPTTKVAGNIPSGFSISEISSFKII